MHFVHACPSLVMRKAAVSLKRATKQSTKVVIDMSEQFAKLLLLENGPALSRSTNIKYRVSFTHYCAEDVLPLEDIFMVRGTAPPSSRNSLDAPVFPPVFVELNSPVK